MFFPLKINHREETNQLSGLVRPTVPAIIFGTNTHLFICLSPPQFDMCNRCIMEHISWLNG